MAMNIISKEKKEIKWIGLPTNSAQECQNLEVKYGGLFSFAAFLYSCFLITREEQIPSLPFQDGGMPSVPHRVSFWLETQILEW